MLVSGLESIWLENRIGRLSVGEAAQQPSHAGGVHRRKPPRLRAGERSPWPAPAPRWTHRFRTQPAVAISSVQRLVHIGFDSVSENLRNLPERNTYNPVYNELHD